MEKYIYYIIYNGINQKEVVLISSNFKENGLVNNHEYSLANENADKQKQMADILMWLVSQILMRFRIVLPVCFCYT
jgi:hypothetical protein